MPKTTLCRAVLLASSALGAGASAPAWAQSAADDIIVTARRVEERLQDVPISISVLNQQQLSNNNVQNTKDLATYTPGLTLNARYGADNSSFAIRGFTQEQRTTATVGTYFADVVAPRGNGATTGGDGAGPGALFDLQNVQVLKGPQGTLQGRNATGGAVLIVPRKPTGAFEGYVEGSAGDYDLRRVQAVVNVPVMDSLRIRLGVDRSTRDGYLKNAGRIGFGPYGDAGGSQDYIALRASVVADLAPNLENYTIISYSHSKATPTIPKVTQCFPGSPARFLGTPACNQIARENAYGDFWTVSNTVTNTKSEIITWQAINTTTWQPSDSLTIKNIASYAELRNSLNFDLFGVYNPTVTPGTETNGNQISNFTLSGPIANRYTNSESTFVEELQFQGRPGSGKFIWQGGLYFESSQPLGQSGTQSSSVSACVDVSQFNCATPARSTYSTTLTRYRGIAAYGQASYNITDKLKLTGGLRYTWDKMSSDFQIISLNIASTGVTGSCSNVATYGAAGSANNPVFAADQRFSRCQQSRSVSSEAPTWMIDLDYKPMDDVLLYVKYSRGYRQGGVNPFGADPVQNYNKESVDTYEGGAKASWRGSFPGHVNLAGYYNSFKNQQIQLGVQCIAPLSCTQTTAIVNVGKSFLYGYEAEFGISPFTGLQLDVSYAYIKTKIQQINTTAFLAAVAGLYNDIRPPAVGDNIPGATPHKWNVSASYTLPLAESVGKVSVGGTFVYASTTQMVADSCVPGRNGITSASQCVVLGDGKIPGYGLLNLNASWTNVAGGPVDLGFFMTNVTNKQYYLSANAQGQQYGFVSNIIGEPRMYGFRLKYHW